MATILALRFLRMAVLVDHFALRDQHGCEDGDGGAVAFAMLSAERKRHGRFLSTVRPEKRYDHIRGYKSQRDGVIFLRPPRCPGFQT